MSTRVGVVLGEVDMEIKSSNENALHFEGQGVGESKMGKALPGWGSYANNNADRNAEGLPLATQGCCIICPHGTPQESGWVIIGKKGVGVKLKRGVWRRPGGQVSGGQDSPPPVAIC